MDFKMTLNAQVNYGLFWSIKVKVRNRIRSIAHSKVEKEDDDSKNSSSTFYQL